MFDEIRMKGTPVMRDLNDIGPELPAGLFREMGLYFGADVARQKKSGFPVGKFQHQGCVINAHGFISGMKNFYPSLVREGQGCFVAEDFDRGFLFNKLFFHFVVRRFYATIAIDKKAMNFEMMRQDQKTAEMIFMRMSDESHMNFRNVPLPKIVKKLGGMLGIARVDQQILVLVGLDKNAIAIADIQKVTTRSLIWGGEAKTVVDKA